MILRNLSAAADWKFAARSMDEQTGSFAFLCDLLADIGFEIVRDEYDSGSALIFVHAKAAPVGSVFGASEAIVSFDDPSIWEEDEAVVIPCPEPSPVLAAFESMTAEVSDQRTGDHGWRRGMEAGARLESSEGRYFGFTPWGRAFEAGLAYGAWFCDWPTA